MSNMYDEFESIQKTKPEHQILDVLARLGISYELFTATSSKTARKIGETILKSLVSELHPDRGNDISEFNGVTIQDINHVRALLADDKVDITKEAQTGGYAFHKLARQSSELEYVKKTLKNQRAIGAVLLKDLIETNEGEKNQHQAKNVTILNSRLISGGGMTKDGDFYPNEEPIFVDQAIRFNENGTVCEVSDFYVEPKNSELLMVKKIDQKAANDITELYSDLITYELESLKLMIHDGELYSSAAYQSSFVSTGIKLHTDKQNSATIKNISGVPLKLAFAKPKNASTTSEKIVTPVFKYNEPEEAESSSRLIGSKFFGYFYFDRRSDDSETNKDMPRQNALQLTNSINKKGSVSKLSMDNLRNLQANATMITTDITNNDVNNMRQHGHTVTVFFKKNRSGRMEFYLVPEVYKVLDPKI